jgi:hypothetical protein
MLYITPMDIEVMGDRYEDFQELLAELNEEEEEE